MELKPPSKDFKLEEPEELKTVDEYSTEVTNYPKPDEKTLNLIDSKSKNFIKELSILPRRSPQYARKLNEVSTLAEGTIRKTGLASSEILERRSTSVAGSNGEASKKIASDLSELRGVVTDLTPDTALTPVKRFFGKLPGNKLVRNYFQRYESSQQQLEKVLKSMDANAELLNRDSNELEKEKAQLWNDMGELNQYIILAENLKEDLKTEIQSLKDEGDFETAEVLEKDGLNALYQRQQDLMTQFGVAVQGYMAMGIIQQNNIELVKGVQRAKDTTLFSLRNAVIVAQALDDQAFTLDQISALNDVTENTITSVAKMLKQNTARIHKQASESGVSIETLRDAFNMTNSTLDEIDSFKLKQNATMEKNIESLKKTLQEVRPQLERSMALGQEDSSFDLDRELEGQREAQEARAAQAAKSITDATKGSED